MKKFITAITAILFTFSLNTYAFAHSHIGETIPADGEVVTEALSEVVLNFEDGIEQGSLMEIYASNGDPIEISEIVVGDNQLIGTLANPLPNDEYKVEWAIISADGHPLTGNYTFTVNIDEVPVVEEEPSQRDETEVAEETVSNEEQVGSQETNQEEETKASSSMTWTVVGFIALILIVVVAVLSRRKK